MPARHVNRVILLGIGAGALGALVAVYTAYWLLSNELQAQRQSELSVAGIAASHIASHYFSSSGSELRRLAESDALDKFRTAYNSLAVRGYAEPLLERFDWVEITASHGERAKLGQPPSGFDNTAILNGGSRSAMNRIDLGTFIDEQGVSYMVFTYRYVDYFDEPVAIIVAGARMDRLLPSISQFSSDAKIRVAIADEAGNLLLNTDLPTGSNTIKHAIPAGLGEGFHARLRFPGCDCVAAVSSLSEARLSIISAMTRDHHLASLIRLRWIVVTSAFTIVLGAVVVIVLLRQASARLNERYLIENKIRFKNEFMAKMSHELRTPLNAIIGYSELLQEELEEMTAQEVRSDLKKVMSAAKHLLGLINQVLDLQKIEAGKMDLYLEEFVLDELVREAVDTMVPLARRSGGQLSVTIHEPDCEIVSDSMKIRQVLLNCLSNAVKFSRSGGRIDVEVRRFVRHDAVWYRIDVVDQGPGIDAKDLKKLFQEFSQLETTSRHNNLGTGLGLAINKRLCELLGGDIYIESRRGVGTRVIVELPQRILSRTP